MPAAEEISEDTGAAKLGVLSELDGVLHKQKKHSKMAPRTFFLVNNMFSLELNCLWQGRS